MHATTMYAGGGGRAWHITQIWTTRLHSPPPSCQILPEHLHKGIDTRAIQSRFDGSTTAFLLPKVPGPPAGELRLRHPK